MTATAYPASPVKRSRRTCAEIDDLDTAIIAAVAADSPVTLRGVFYRVMSAGACAQDERAILRNLIGREVAS